MTLELRLRDQVETRINDTVESLRWFFCGHDSVEIVEKKKKKLASGEGGDDDDESEAGDSAAKQGAGDVVQDEGFTAQMRIEGALGALYKLTSMDGGIGPFGKKRIFYPKTDPIAVYEGSVIDGKRHGKGIMIYKDGSYFDGNFLQDMRHGKGLLIANNGHRYDGEWVEDIPSGRGKITFPNGDTYDGGLEDGCIFTGKGRYEWADGRCYDGEWTEDLMEGTGVYKYSNGDSYSGRWKEDMPHGDGVKVEGGRAFATVHQQGDLQTFAAKDARYNFSESARARRQ